ncbi:MAG: AAA family ATPase [Gemmatimonadetes bacterium]|nr:AAA family ATPase [Gemmatimonadota bacterium]
MIQLRLLGPVELRVNGQPPPADLLWRKHLALLVYLACSQRGRARDHLIGMFWPEKDDQKARHSLNEALRVLRRSLGDALVTEADVVRLEPGSIHSDLEEPGGHGIFLEGFALPDAPAFEDWVARERAIRRADSLDALVAGGERALAEGALRDARDAAHQALTLDGQHEPSVRLLMRASALSGDRAGALDAYTRHARALREEMNADAEPETRALADRIRAAAALPGSGERVARPVAEPVPIVGPGRRLLARLGEVWDGARRGCHVAIIRGDPGTGRTRLGDELAARARLDGAAVCVARAVENDAAADVWRTWLRGLVEAELGGAAPEALAALALLDPDVAVRFPGTRGATPQAAPDAMVSGIAAVADARPVLLVLDDADRAHADALRFAFQLAQRVAASRVVVLLTTALRGGEVLDDLMARIGRDVPGVVVETGSLEEPDVAALVAWGLPAYDPGAATRVVRRVMADTAGNPFLAVEVIRAVRDGLAVSGSESRAWPARHRTLDDTLPGDLPPIVVAALRQRFRALSEHAQRALIVVAVLGGRVAMDALARGARLDPEALARSLDELEWERWLAGDARGYDFVTRLAREVILAEMVTGGEQRRVRERAAGRGE